MRHYIERGAVVIGLTATPVRADGKGFRSLFEVLYQVATPRQLMAEGWLSEPTVLGPRVSFADVKIGSTGDYDPSALTDAVNARVIVGDLIETWKKHAEGRTTVVFETSVARSIALTAGFCDLGIRAEHLDGTTPTDVRDAMLRRLATGMTTIVSNMNVLSEGWDLPRAKCALIARPTNSPSFWLQMCGRVLRPWESIRPVILDHGGNADLHGCPQDDPDWSLDGVKKRAHGHGETIRPCPQCYAPLEGGTAVCPACGYVFPPREVQGPQEQEGELVEITEAQGRARRRAWYREKLQHARRLGRSVGWARHRYQEQWQNWPHFFRDEAEFYPKAASAP